MGYFGRRQLFAEDALAVGRLLLAGYQVAYVPEAWVYHSHDYGLLDEFKRYFDMGVTHRREQWLLATFGRASGQGMAYMRSGWRYLRRRRALRLFAPFCLRAAMKLVGYRLGLYSHLLPAGLRPRLSMQPSWWRREAPRES